MISSSEQTGSPLIAVAAAVLLQGDRFLLACRPPGKFCAGQWEFPGGKVEPGESSHAALIRELQEEMGISVTHATPWLTRRFVYPHAHVAIRFWRVTEWTGKIDLAAPMEHSALAWQSRKGTLTVAPILPANAPILAALALPDIMALTHAEVRGEAEEMARLEAALVAARWPGEVGLVLRDRNLAPEARRRWLQRVAALAARHTAPFWISVNAAEACADAALARELGASGLHLTAHALRTCVARPDFPQVGASCHTAEELDKAEALGLDYAFLGAVLPTPSHPEAAGLGWSGFAQRVSGRGLPVFALGGQSRATLVTAQEYGAHGIAALRASLVSSTGALQNHE
ncbi:MAG: Nudix family hydrolase [Zoogloeaceae bacterium]|jgi:8-oxo-dGTP diphosphatase|nr:Nudix family hydrolase [Zoogloeaceae bacterium]